MGNTLSYASQVSQNRIRTRNLPMLASYYIQVTEERDKYLNSTLLGLNIRVCNLSVVNDNCIAPSTTTTRPADGL